jgi:3-oxoacyl-[acyl-carrier-protein] synthase III
MIYINSIGTISPQGAVKDGHFVCVEPVYKEFINPIQLRRMSRILKMGLGASTICINNLPEAAIDAVIVGTGQTCMADLEKFLVSILYENEQMLSPTPFINSSHNTVAAQIAMMHNVTGYNITYSHRGSSFESALKDALLLLDEGEAKHALIGGIDEYSYLHHFLMSEERNMKNTVLGEGTAFFIMEKERRNNSFAKLKSVHSFLTYNNSDNQFIKTEISDFLQKQNLNIDDIDIFVSGKNGNCLTDSIYDELKQDFFPKAETIYFKNLCGEYMTATALALANTANQLKNSENKYALIYNHYNYINHSLILLQTIN